MTQCETRHASSFKTATRCPQCHHGSVLRRLTHPHDAYNTTWRIAVTFSFSGTSLNLSGPFGTLEPVLPRKCYPHVWRVLPMVQHRLEASQQGTLPFPSTLLWNPGQHVHQRPHLFPHPSSDRKSPHIRGQQSRPFVLIWIMSTSFVSPMVLRQSIFSRSLPRYEPWLKWAHSSFTPGSQSNNLTRSAMVAVIVGPIVGIILLQAIGIILFKRRRRPKARYSRPVRWSSGQRAGRRIANGNRI